MCLAASRFELAYECYEKLCNCAHTFKDIIIKVYALKQMSHCLMKLESYEQSIICLKHVLAISWTIKFRQLELVTY